jgi:hypothetical protein
VRVERPLSRSTGARDFADTGRGIGRRRFRAPRQPSTPISVDVEVEGDAPEARLSELVQLVDEIAEIPNSIRGTTPVEIRARRLVSTG